MHHLKVGTPSNLLLHMDSRTFIELFRNRIVHLQTGLDQKMLKIR